MEKKDGGFIKFNNHRIRSSEVSSMKISVSFYYLIAIICLSSFLIYGLVFLVINSVSYGDIRFPSKLEELYIFYSILKKIGWPAVFILIIMYVAAFHAEKCFHPKKYAIKITQRNGKSLLSAPMSIEYAHVFRNHMQSMDAINSLQESFDFHYNRIDPTRVVAVGLSRTRDHVIHIFWAKVFILGIMIGLIGFVTIPFSAIFISYLGWGDVNVTKIHYGMIITGAVSAGLLFLMQKIECYAQLSIILDSDEGLQRKIGIEQTYNDAANELKRFRNLFNRDIPYLGNLVEPT